MKIFQLLIASVALAFPLAAHAEDCSIYDVELATTASPPITPEAFKAASLLMEKTPQQADVVLIGDSLFQQWSSAGDDLKNKSLWNFSVFGDATQNVLWRLGKVNLAAVSPRAVYIFIGTNNLSKQGAQACGVAEGVKKVIETVKSAWPQAAIYPITLPPRGADFLGYDELRVKTNELIKGTASIANVFPIVLDDKEMTSGQYGKPKLPSNTLSCAPDTAYQSENYKDDHLHLKPGGYAYIRSQMVAATEKHSGADILPQ